MHANKYMYYNYLSGTFLKIPGPEFDSSIVKLIFSLLGLICIVEFYDSLNKYRKMGRPGLGLGINSRIYASFSNA